MQQRHAGEPFTDDITANPRTRMNSIQTRILPFTREKQISPSSMSTVDEGTSHHHDAVHDDNANEITDHNARASSNGNVIPSAITADEGVIGAGGLERSASRPHGHIHNENTSSTIDNVDADRDLEKQEHTIGAPENIES